MAYEKTKWVSGVTLLSAENFNKMEDGIEGALSLGTQAGQAATNANTKANQALQETANNKLTIETLKEFILALPTKEFVLQAIKEALGGNIPDIPDTPDIPDVPEGFYVNVVSDTNGAIILEGTYYHVVSDTNGYIILN